MTYRRPYASTPADLRAGSVGRRTASFQRLRDRDRIAWIRLFSSLRRIEVDAHRYEGLIRAGEPENFAVWSHHPALTTIDTRLVEPIRRQAESSRSDRRRAAAYHPLVDRCAAGEPRRHEEMHAFPAIQAGLLEVPELGADQESNLRVEHRNGRELWRRALIPGCLPYALLVR